MSRTILITDDSESIRELVGFTLESAGYHVIKGADGAEAQRLLDGREVDLVITDLNMPNVDGIQFIRSVRATEQYGTVPIIMLTTESARSSMEEAVAAGVTAWVVKPFEAEGLLATVKKVLR